MIDAPVDDLFTKATITQNVGVFYHCQLKEARPHVRSFIELHVMQFRTTETTPANIRHRSLCSEFIQEVLMGHPAGIQALIKSGI